MASTANAEPGWIQKAAVLTRSLMHVAGAQTPGPVSSASPRPLAVSWTRSGATGKSTGTQMQCWHNMQKADLLCHNASHSFFFLIFKMYNLIIECLHKSSLHSLLQDSYASISLAWTLSVSWSGHAQRRQAKARSEQKTAEMNDLSCRSSADGNRWHESWKKQGAIKCKTCKKISSSCHFFFYKLCMFPADDKDTASLGSLVCLAWFSQEAPEWTQWESVCTVGLSASDLESSGGVEFDFFFFLRIAILERETFVAGKVRSKI